MSKYLLIFSCIQAHLLLNLNLILCCFVSAYPNPTAISFPNQWSLTEVQVRARYLWCLQSSSKHPRQSSVDRQSSLPEDNAQCFASTLYLVIKKNINRKFDFWPFCVIDITNQSGFPLEVLVNVLQC